LATLHSKQQHLLRISKAKQNQIIGWKDGVFLGTLFGASMTDLEQMVVADRIALARRLRQRGLRLMRSKPPMHRDAISRFYYSMYHSMRAVVYYANHGDDHERHSELPRHIPADFPNQALWANELTSARETRNASDYDPYPKTEAPWAKDAAVLDNSSRRLLLDVVNYLRTKGCRGL
jgi:uncharacterized protein (UPF0332 family)